MKFSFLYNGYRTDKGMVVAWEAVVMFRKLAITTIPILNEDPYVQVLLALILLVFSYGIHEKFLPFETTLLNMLETIGLFILIATQIISILYLYIDEKARTTGKKDKVLAYAQRVLESCGPPPCARGCRCHRQPARPRCRPRRPRRRCPRPRRPPPFAAPPLQCQSVAASRFAYRVRVLCRCWYDVFVSAFDDDMNGPKHTLGTNTRHAARILGHKQHTRRVNLRTRQMDENDRFGSW